MSVNLQLIPAKGMTLPFISYGGSSMVSLAYGVGMMLALTRQRPRTEMESIGDADAARELRSDDERRVAVGYLKPWTTAPLILLAAGGTGGHLFPAEALGVELIRRGFRVRLVTDARALRYSGLFSKDTIDVVPSETVRGRTPWSLARTGADARRRHRGRAQSDAPAEARGRGRLRRLSDPAAADRGAAVRRARRSSTMPMRCSAAPTVFCRAASARSRPRCRACSIAIRRWRRKTTTVGTPMRPAILAAAAVQFVAARAERAACACWWSAAARARA